MSYVIITLLVVGLVLFISSFFVNSRLEDVENQVEQLSISTLQDSYVLKNKIKVLEEELLTDTMDLDSLNISRSEQEEPGIVKNIKALYDQGYDLDKIESKTGLSKNDIQTIINQKTTNRSFG